MKVRALSWLVQLGGLEPPTSCSTDRRSNQLSYNCILVPAPKTGRRTGRKLGATPVFGKAGRPPYRRRSRARRHHFGCRPAPPKTKAQANRPGLFLAIRTIDQAAGLNSFDAL